MAKIRFKESFFPVFFWRDFVFHQSPQSAPESPFVDPSMTVSKLRNVKKPLSMWDDCTYHRVVSQKAFSSFSLRVFPFSSSSWTCSRISLGTCFSKSVSPTLYEKRGITLWVECTRHKAVPQKASLQFWSEHISFFTISLKVLPNIPSHAKHTQG